MRMHKNIRGGGHLLGTSGAILALLLGVMLFPIVPDSAHAETPATRAEASPRATTSVGLTVPATIEFTDVMATPSGATTTASAKIGVTTTASAGYKLYLYAKDNSLKSLNPSTTQSIASASASSLNNFTNNTWGYNLGTSAPDANTTYAAVPTDNAAPIQTQDTSDTNSANDTYTLSLGAKVDSTIPSGTYTSTLTISVVAEPAILAFEGIETMQEMTSAICSNADEGETARLKDDRDGKLYWVAKLADNQCWMTQNLDFDIPASGLTSADSDVTSTWNSSSAYPPTATSTTNSSNSSNTGTLSWDLGMYVKSDPDGYSRYCGDEKGLFDSSCTLVGWTDVSSMTPMTDGTSNEVISGNTYNAHYLVGNYYQWNAATAGTGGADVVGRDATDSICPKGWKLPTSNNQNKGSFYYLLDQYGLNSSYNSTTITQSPLYFHPSGYVDSGSLWNAGNFGYYWSSTADSSTSGAYYLYFTLGRVNPSYNYYRYYGRSVRCLAR